MNLCFTTPKGHIKPKVDWHSVDSPKNCTNEFILFAFHCKQNKIIRSFFGGIYDAPKRFFVLSDL